MKEKAEKIEALNRFKINKKFSDEVWQNRGLNPSSIELNDQLEKTFNLFADHLAQALKAGSTAQQLTATLKSDLAG